MEILKYTRRYTCSRCQKVFESNLRSKEDSFKRRGKVYCSKEGGMEALREVRSKTMAATNRKYASERMKKKNPMKDPVSKNKMIETLKSIGHKPPKHGGNGNITLPQKKLAQLLGWETEVVILTKVKKINPQHLATHYKLDIANRELKIGIEIDGRSHGSIERRAQDIKKTVLLNSLGWTVLRFSNKEVMENLNGCVRTVLSTISKLKGPRHIQQTGL